MTQKGSDLAASRLPIRDGWLACVGPGWVSLVEPLIQRCIDEGATILQVKEKFGGLRFYVDEASDELCAAIDAAERESYKVCEGCGAPGEPREGGWTRTLCDVHANGRGPGGWTRLEVKVGTD
jgi:hypothetical protein